MDDDTTPPSQRRDIGNVAGRPFTLVEWCNGLGITLAAVGLVDGVVMLLKRRLIDCPDGTDFPAGATDLNCYSHPEAGAGLAVVTTSLLLGILVVLASLIAKAVLARAVTRSTRRPAHPDDWL